MKRYCILFCVLLLLFSGCADVFSGTEADTDIGMSLEGYPVSNEPLTDRDTAYPIEDLTRCFQASETELIYLDDIHSEFPITHLRKNEDQERYYIAYPVLEGGKYLVFLNMVLDPGSGDEKAVFGGSIYVFGLPAEEDFANLEAGDTFEDVLALQSYTVMPVISSGFLSYSLLRDGNVMQCSYTRTNNQELILSDMKLLTPEDPEYPYSGMVPSDLDE